MKTLDRLAEQYREYCDNQGLPEMSADELLAEGIATDEQNVWLANFRTRWDKAQEPECQLKKLSPTMMMGVIEYRDAEHGTGCWAFVPVVAKDGPYQIALGVCIEGENGYYPISHLFCGGDDYNTMSDYADELNEDKLGLSIERSMSIVGSSMRNV